MIFPYFHMRFDVDVWSRQGPAHMINKELWRESFVMKKTNQAMWGVKREDFSNSNHQINKPKIATHDGMVDQIETADKWHDEQQVHISSAWTKGLVK